MHYTLLTEVEIVSVLGGFDEPWNSMIWDCGGKKQKSGSAVPVYEGLWVHLKSMITGLIIHTGCLSNSLINVSQIDVVSLLLNSNKAKTTLQYICYDHALSNPFPALSGPVPTPAWFTAVTSIPLSGCDSHFRLTSIQLAIVSSWRSSEYSPNQTYDFSYCSYCLLLHSLSLTHWLGDSSFSAQFMVKNVVCFSNIFHWKKWW
jgi:hypothetical protein